MNRAKMALLVVGFVILSSFSIIGMYGSNVAADSVDDGECGEDMDWEQNYGSLFIWGDGYMWDYEAKNGITTAPWTNEVGLLEWGRGPWGELNTREMDSIGKYAFYGMGNLDDIAWIDNGDGDDYNSQVSLEFIDSWAFAKSAIFKPFSDWGGTAAHFPYLKWIGDHAFYDCWNLSAINLSTAYALKSIGDHAFAKSPKLSSVILPDSVTEIGREIFADCGKLKTVKLSPNISEIPRGAFRNCISLESIEINGSNVTIEKEAFAGCVNLERIVINCENLTIEDGFVDCSKIHDLSISASTLIIGDHAFESNTHIQNLTLKADEIILVECAFESCPELKSVDIESKSTELGKSAFGHCNKLDSIMLSQDELTVGFWAFEECSSLKSLSLCAREMTLDSAIFYRSNNLNDVTIQAENLKANPEAFAYWAANCEMTVLPWKDGIIHSGLFKGVDIPSIKIDGNCTSIEGHAFEGCKQMIGISIPDSVKTIGDYAFAGSGLRSTVMPGPSVIMGEGVYSGCKDLSYITTKERQDIPSKTFEGCKDLTNFILPGSVTSIGDRAFEGCKYLLKIDLSNVERVGDEAFANTSLASVAISHDIELGAGCFSGCGKLKSIQVPIDLSLAPSVGCNLFDGLGSLEIIEFTHGSGTGCDYEKGAMVPMWQSITNNDVKVILDESIEYIGKYTFEGFEALKEIVIPDFVIRIGEGAFNGCSGLSKITVGYSLSVIEDGAFDGCISLKEVVNKSPLYRMSPGDTDMGGISKYAETVHQDSYTEFSGDYFIVVNSAFDECLILNYSGSMSGDYVLPSEFASGSTVVHKVKIHNDVFSNAQFSSITIGDNCLYVGKNALSVDYWGPVTIIIDSPGAYIAGGALSISDSDDRGNLDRVILASGMNIDDDAFPDDLFYIGDRSIRGNELAGHEWVSDGSRLYPSDKFVHDFDSDKQNADEPEFDSVKAVATIAVFIVTAIFIAHVARKD